MSAIPLERGACIAEALPRPRGLDVGRAPAPLIGLLPVEVVPESVRPALEAYAVDLGEASSSRDHLKSAVDQVGHGWELAIASRAVAARAELVDACRQATALHDEMVTLQAAAQWLRRFPWRSSWELEPYELHVAGRQIAVPEILGVIEDTVDVDERLIRIARRSAPHDPPYVPLRPPLARRGSAPAKNALAEAGQTLSDVARLMPPAGASISAVSRWLAGDRPYPAQLPGVLEQVVGDAGTVARILALIPG